jgi:hypothetical protein
VPSRLTISSKPFIIVLEKISLIRHRHNHMSSKVSALFPVPFQRRLLDFYPLLLTQTTMSNDFTTTPITTDSRVESSVPHSNPPTLTGSSAPVASGLPAMPTTTAEAQQTAMNLMNQAQQVSPLPCTTEEKREKGEQKGRGKEMDLSGCVGRSYELPR